MHGFGMAHRFFEVRLLHDQCWEFELPRQRVSTQRVHNDSADC